MAEAFTHIYDGNSGYVFAFPDGPRVLDNGDKVTLTPELAKSLGDEFVEIDGYPQGGDQKQVLAWVGDDPARAAEALEAERAKGDKASAKFVERLESLAAPS